MKEIRQIQKGSKGTWFLLAAAVILLMFSAMGSTRAALTYYSENYTAQMQIHDIGVTLVEKSAKGTKNISSRDYAGSDDKWEQTQGALLSDMLEETGGRLLIGRDYTEELSVKNSGNIDAYVRVRIFKNWTKTDGSKETTLAPSLIVLNLTNNGWLIDQKASTEERTVLYWPRILKAGKATAAFSDTIRIDDAVASKVSKTTKTKGGLTTITTTFLYDGVQFNLEAEVDAVQTHNGVDAVKSAWGVDVEIAPDGTLSLAQ